VEQGIFLLDQGICFSKQGMLRVDLAPAALLRPTAVADIRQRTNVSADMRCFGRRHAPRRRCGCRDRLHLFSQGNCPIHITIVLHWQARSAARSAKPDNLKSFRQLARQVLGRSKAEIARLLGVSRQTLYDILAEKQPITPAMALRIGKLCGNGPDLWINMQRAFDLDVAEKELAREIEKIPTLTAA
jgi:addiction module HigA family antidote